MRLSFLFYFFSFSFSSLLPWRWFLGLYSPHPFSFHLPNVLKSTTQAGNLVSVFSTSRHFSSL